MDIFSTTVTVLQEIYAITIFIKGVVDDVKSYESDTDIIKKKLRHEFVFVDTFRDLFFGDDTMSESYKQQPRMLQEDVKSTLDQLKTVLAEYGLEAAKYGILSHDADKDKDRTGVIVAKNNQDVHNRVRRFVDSASSKVKDIKLKAFDWSLFEKAKILKMLEIYSEWTQRLRQSMTLMTEKMLLKGLTSFRQFANTQQANDLGLKEVATRRSLMQAMPDGNFAALDGAIVKDSERPLASNIMMAKFQADWSPKPKDVVLEYRKYDRPLRQAVDANNEEKIMQLKSPLRNLAWLLCNSPFPEDTDDDAVIASKHPTLLTLRCIGYIDQPEEYQMQFIYDPPMRNIIQDELAVKTLHALITSTGPTIATSEQKFLQLWQDLWLGRGEKWTTRQKPKPSLRIRFFLAYALALTVLNIHSSGWVHKNLWSHAIVIIPSANRTQRSGAQHLIPYVTGWGVARPTSAETTDMKPIAEIEPNLYQHPHRQQQPSIKYTFLHDVYSLGVLLMEIGLWNTVSNLFQRQIQQATHARKAPRIDLLQMAWADGLKEEVKSEMGDIYAEAVERCLMGTFGIEQDDINDTNLAVKFTNQVVEAIKPGLTL